MSEQSPLALSRRRVAWGMWGAAGVVGVWLLAPGLPVSGPPAADPVLASAGKVLFEHEWAPNDPLAEGDGLGPVFNAKSCAACHFQGGVGGAGGNKSNVASFVVHPTIREPSVREGVIHAFAVTPQYQETRDLVATIYPIVPGGIRVFEGCQRTFKDFDPVRFDSINTPALFGAGWMDQISTRVVWQSRTSRGLGNISREFESDAAVVGIGRVRKLSDGRIGKFGWKAQFATLEEFVSAACANEVGLGTPRRDQAVPLGQSASSSDTPDLTQEQFAAMVAFVEALPRPVQILPSDPQQRSQAVHGEKVFSSVGCAACHTPELAGVAGFYSDLLLHKLVDDQNLQYGSRDEPEVPWPGDEPLPDEWKTPPLWGVADSAPYFHDGRSPDLISAILRHRGAAKDVTEKYRKLAAEDREALLAFLQTLKAPALDSYTMPTQSTELAKR